jgi:hypothetical protein
MFKHTPLAYKRWRWLILGQWHFSIYRNLGVPWGLKYGPGWCFIKTPKVQVEWIHRSLR